jgi:DNA ligase-associated metallophosphoesterase
LSAALRASDVPEATRIELAGVTCLLDPSGVMYLPDVDALVVADLHLEKGSSLAKRGMMLPPYDTVATLAALTEVVERYDPAWVIALGDSFHDRHGPGRLSDDDRTTLARLVVGRRWTWILGNHDPELPETLGGEMATELVLGSLVFRHHPTASSPCEVAGHLHPVAKVVLRGRGVRARSFLTDGQRCVMPAFGAYAGGLNACDSAFAPLFPTGFTAHVIGRSRTFALSHTILCGDGVLGPFPSSRTRR